MKNKLLERCSVISEHPSRQADQLLLQNKSLDSLNSRLCKRKGRKRRTHAAFSSSPGEITSVYLLLNSSLFRVNAAYVCVVLILSTFYFMMCWFSCLFSTVKKAHGEPGVAMCGANSPSVSCVSVQSSNTSERVRRPQPDAISEYIYSGVNQSLKRPCLPHGFPLF